MRVALASIVLAAAVVACAPDELGASTTTSAGTSTSLASTTTLPEPTPTTTVRVSTTTITPEMDVELVDGEVVGPDVFEVELGGTVDIWIMSDVDDEMHVHGYDLMHDLVAGEPFRLSFVADVPGIFEVEAHTGHTLLFELRVSG